MTSRPLARGTLLAATAATLFGATIPIVQRAGTHVGPFATAATLYLGAALATIRLRVHPSPTLPRAASLRLLALATIGAVLAPSALAFGLQNTNAFHASLLQNLEGTFTLLLAWLLYREHLSKRVALAVSLMLLAGCTLVYAAPSTTAQSLSRGPWMVVLAVMLWAVDSTLTRPLADLDTVLVVRRKALLGVALAGLVALTRQEPLPTPSAALVLLLCGALGYGVSLRLYLLAQRLMGAGRTGAVFSLAPFVGALVAFVLHPSVPSRLTLVGAALAIVALWLHSTESHAHEHSHLVLAHEHAHRHDDGHHTHSHEGLASGHAEHSHWHEHSALSHEHEHGDDLHHQHPHP
ncbi:MAG: DMT family transporter [Deltaproteobacteria bacterium]|nr:DMT family transporter [Deltaproteobacteria bacterium]